MAESIKCPKCGCEMALLPEFAGQIVPCTKCNTKLRMPQTRPVVPGQSQRSSNGLLDLLDFGFKRYLTPLIIRFTWMVVLAIATLWLGTLTLFYVISLTGDSVSISSSTGTTTTGGSLPRPVWNFLIYATSCFFVVLGVLWARVILECTIVIFNMAASLKSMEETLNDRRLTD